MASQSQGCWSVGFYPDGSAFLVLKDLEKEGRLIELRDRGVHGGMGLYLWKNREVGIGIGNIPFDSFFGMLSDFINAKGDTSDEGTKERLAVFNRTEEVKNA